MQLWWFDCLGGLGSKELLTDMGDLGVRQDLMAVVLAYTLMDDMGLGFDLAVYGNPECTVPCEHTASLDGHSRWATSLNGHTPEFYIRMALFSGETEETYRLAQRIFIRPGIACRGTVCFLADRLGQQPSNPTCMVKFSWRYTTMTAEGALFEKLSDTGRGVFGLVRLLNHDEARTVVGNIRKGTRTGTAAGRDRLDEEQCVDDPGRVGDWSVGGVSAWQG